MIFPPLHFDLNEWAVIIAIVVFGVIALCLRRIFSTSIIVIILLFSIAVARLFDHMLALPYLLDLYDMMDLNKVEWFDLVIYLMFAPPGYLFVYLYERWDMKELQIPVYVLVWSAFSTGVEWVFHLCHVFTYKEWNIAYSFAVYLFVQSITLWFFECLKGWHALDRSVKEES